MARADGKTLGNLPGAATAAPVIGTQPVIPSQLHIAVLEHVQRIHLLFFGMLKYAQE